MSAQASFTTKMDLLWQTNKPLFVGIIALITLIVFAIVFCIVYFLIIRPNQQSDQTFEDDNSSANNAVITTTHMLYKGLRNYIHWLFIHIQMFNLSIDTLLHISNLTMHGLMFSIIFFLEIDTSFRYCSKLHLWDSACSNNSPKRGC